VSLHLNGPGTLAQNATTTGDDGTVTATLTSPQAAGTSEVVANIGAITLITNVTFK
jgi:hypothetical protein